MVDEKQTDDRNMTASIAISAAATSLIGYGMTRIANNTTEGLVIVSIGVAIYFIKSYLYNKGYC